LTRRRVLAAVVLLAAAGAALAYFWPFGRGADELWLQGIVEIQEVRLGSKIGGRVECLAYNPRTQLLIKEGDLVEKGQELVRFETPELKAQEQQWIARVKADEAARDRAEHGPRKQEKDAGWAVFQASQAKLERLIEGYREEEVRQARNDRDAARADMNQAKEEWDRMQQLYPRGASRADYDTARFAYNRARARYEAARAKSDMLEAGSRREDIDEAYAAMWECWNKYSLLKEGTREEDKREAQAKLEESRGRLREVQANLREAVLRAPERAVIEVLAVRKGDLVTPNQPIIRVLKADDLWVKVYVPETELGKVRLNQKVDVTIDSYPGRHFAGTVIQIASISEFTPRNIQSADERRHQVFGVKVRVDNADGIFKSGMAAEVRVPLHQ
jgi:multidrug resistance efflux pump